MEAIDIWNTVRNLAERKHVMPAILSYDQKVGAFVLVSTSDMTGDIVVQPEVAYAMLLNSIMQWLVKTYGDIAISPEENGLFSATHIATGIREESGMTPLHVLAWLGNTMSSGRPEVDRCLEAAQAMFPTTKFSSIPAMGIGMATAILPVPCLLYKNAVETRVAMETAKAEYTAKYNTHDRLDSREKHIQWSKDMGVADSKCRKTILAHGKAKNALVTYLSSYRECDYSRTTEGLPTRPVEE